MKRRIFGVSSAAIFSTFLYGITSTPAFAVESCTQTNNELVSTIGYSAKKKQVQFSVWSDKNQCGCTWVGFEGDFGESQLILSLLFEAEKQGKKINFYLEDKTKCTSVQNIFIIN